MPRRPSFGRSGSNKSLKSEGGRRWRSRSPRSRSRSRSRSRKQQSDGIDLTGFEGGAIGNSADYAYVSSPPRKSALTGNISSLFRTFKRGGSGGRSVASEAIHHSQRTDYPTSLGAVTSPENAGLVYSRSDVGAADSTQNPQFLVKTKQKKTRFSFGKKKPKSSDNSVQYSADHGSFSVDGRSMASRTSSRLFYSNADDDNSENSFDQKSRGTESRRSKGTASKQGANSESKSAGDVQNILRYRGFSTSIKSLFLDEALVCASMGCFGLFLSNRTEYLLQLRNNRRGVRWGRSTSRNTLPSRILAFSLLLTLILIGFTFIVGGFGSNSNGGSTYAFNRHNTGGSSYDDDANQNQYVDDAAYGNDDAGDDAANADEGAGDDEIDDANEENEGAENNEENEDAENKDENGVERHLDILGSPEFLYGATVPKQHCANGIFKVRDMKEGVWDPTIDFLSDEWYRPYQERRLQNYTNDDYYSTASTSSNRDAASNLRISLIVAFLIILGVLGRRRRMRTRYYLVRARAQEDHLFYASSGADTKRISLEDSREDNHEGACSHTICGCYPTDRPREGGEVEDFVQVNDDGVMQQKKKQYHEDFVGRGFNCLLGLCCGYMCNCWFQCLSICSLAQEAREMRLLVPTRFQRIDYITHQPFHHYQKEVNDLRRGYMGKTRKKAGILPHLKALSKLSRYILMMSISLTTIIVFTLIINPRASFSWPDVTILSATFLQSFLVLWIVHWIFHKSDLSLDAVIKFFTAGFVIAVPSAFFFEGLLANITIIGAFLAYCLGQLMGGQTFVEWMDDHYRILWILVEVFNAYIVATVTEELCKYYTFRCVEHPDLIFLTGLVSTTQDERALEGGVVKYPFSSHQVQQTNARNPYDDDVSVFSKSSHRSRQSGKSGNIRDVDDDDFLEEEQDVRTHRQRAAAVTTAMISVAVGLACAENFLYVFFLGGTGSGSGMDGYLQEWIVLFFRSIFPVHALAAAMQSINMIRKFIETKSDNGHRIGVGRIILPAVIMHGTFDVILLGINVFIETSWDDYMEANGGQIDENNPRPYNPFFVNLVAWLSITSVMLIGFIWYYKENRKQRLRLIEMEENDKAMGSPGYISPRVPRVTDIELI